MSCFGSCVGAPAGSQYYESAEQAKTARFRDKQLTKLLNKYHKEDLKRLKLLLLGEFTLSLKVFEDTEAPFLLVSIMYCRRLKRLKLLLLGEYAVLKASEEIEAPAFG